MTTDRDPRPRRRARGVGNHSWLLGLLGLAAVAPLTGCGSSVPAAAVPTDGPATTLQGSTSAEPDVPGDDPLVPSSGAVSSLDGVRAATVRLEAPGTFIDPDFGAFEAQGGSTHGGATCPVRAPRLVGSLVSSDSLVPGGGRSR